MSEYYIDGGGNIPVRSWAKPRKERTMGITYGDYLIDSGHYDPEEESMPFDAKEYDERMAAAEKRGYTCESLEHAKQSITAALIGSCECNTKSPEATYHMAYCRYLKLLHALDCIDAALSRS